MLYNIPKATWVVVKLSSLSSAIWLCCIPSTFSLNIYSKTHSECLAKLSILPKKKVYPIYLSKLFLCLEKIKSIFLSTELLMSLQKKVAGIP